MPYGCTPADCAVRMRTAVGDGKIVGVVGSVVQVRVAVRRRCGSSADGVDRAAGGIASIQGALRTFQDLPPLQGENAPKLGGRATDIYSVLIVGDARIRAWVDCVGADAPNCDVRFAKFIAEADAGNG